MHRPALVGPRRCTVAVAAVTGAVRPAAAAAAALSGAALALGGCGGVTAADLFLVTRSGSTPHAHLVMLVNEEGVVHCNGAKAVKLSDPQLVQARALQEELHDAAAAHRSYPARPGSVLSYSVRDTDGTVRFSDNSPAEPKVLHELALFVLVVAQQVCRLPE
jgi:hypothetical protein